MEMKSLALGERRKRGNSSEKGFAILSYVAMTALALICFFPCLHLVSKSISSGKQILSGQVLFWPKEIQFKTMRYILTSTDFLACLKNTIIVTVGGTFISMFTTITTAYSLSKPKLRGRKFFTMLYVFSMVFFGGIVPAYMVVNTLGLLDTYWALILPFAIVQFNMFVVKSYFESLPESIEEAAYMDGATDTQTLFRIVLPMSTPILATASLLYAINYWNNYFHAMMYTNSPNMRTLQVYLYDIINNGQAIMENLYGSAFGSSVGVVSQTDMTADGMVAAAVTLSIIPIIMVYPFVQRHMIKGITIGSVKG